MGEVGGTIDVIERHRFDAGRLEDYLTGAIPGFKGPLTARQFVGGQSNPTYLLETPGRSYVLRRKPPGELLPSAHAVDREFRVISGLAGTAVPVPETLHLCADESVVGTIFFVMDFVPGRVITDPGLPGLAAAERGAVYGSMCEVLAALHGVDYAAQGLADFGRQGDYFARQIHRWTGQYRASESVSIPAMEKLIAWLPGNIPDDDATSIVHGDYRVGNMIIDADAPRIKALLDWELSTLGHPLADLAYCCLLYRLPDEVHGLRGADPADLGIPTEAAFVAQYCRLTGRTRIPHWHFYLAFALFRLAAILQGITGRVAAGTASAEDATERGAEAASTAETGWSIVAAASLS